MSPRCLSSLVSSLLPSSALSESSVISVVSLFLLFPDFLLATRHSPLTSIIPALTRRPPVSPIIPALTQNRGVGGAFCKMCSPVTLLFSFSMLTELSTTIVGAPTFSLLRVADTFRWPPEGDRGVSHRDHRDRSTEFAKKSSQETPPIGRLAFPGHPSPREKPRLPIPQRWRYSFALLGRLHL